jgi:hypothetical protein
MCTKRFERHSCNCRGQELPAVSCENYIAAAVHTSSGDFVYSMDKYVQNLADLREKCRQVTQTVEVRVNYKCRECLFEDLVSVTTGSPVGER